MRADPSWRVAPTAPGLTDRRVEITGPPNRRMAVNALKQRMVQAGLLGRKSGRGFHTYDQD